jgi:hypothetical protein
MEASLGSPQGERDDNGEGDLASALKSWESTAKIAEESKVRATAIDAQARKSETLEASFNTALGKTNGEGIENGPGGLQSNFLVSADTFAVVNGINDTLASPFAVTGG